MRKFSELKVGMSATRTFVIADEKIRKAADLFEDHNPVHLDDGYAASTIFAGRIAHGMLVAGYASGLLGEDLPGEGTIFLELNSVQFKRPVRPNDEVTLTATITEITSEKLPKAVFSIDWSVAGKSVITAVAVVTMEECIKNIKRA